MKAAVYYGRNELEVADDPTAFDAAGVAPAVQAALACVGARKPTISVAIYGKPLVRRCSTW